jgi:hypothetical protein
LIRFRFLLLKECLKDGTPCYSNPRKKYRIIVHAVLAVGVGRLGFEDLVGRFRKEDGWLVKSEGMIMKMKKDGSPPLPMAAGASSMTCGDDGEGRIMKKDDGGAE